MTRGIPFKRNPDILPGTTSFRLTVMYLDNRDTKGRAWYLCKCTCGNEKLITGSAFTSGKTKSCGCYNLEVRKARLKPNNFGVIHQIYSGYIRHAKTLGCIFDIPEADFTSLIQKTCCYCGSCSTNIKKTSSCKLGFKYNGIDRIDPKLGYTLDNVVSCCKDCNFAKKNMTKNEFLSWIERVYLFNKQ